MGLGRLGMGVHLLWAWRADNAPLLPVTRQGTGPRPTRGSRYRVNP